MANIKFLTDNDGQVLPITTEAAVLDGNGDPISQKYQPLLVSGTNIKTINHVSILGDGNITIEGGSGGGSGTTDYTDLTNKPKINNVLLSGDLTSSGLGLQDTLVSGTNIKTINNEPILGSGNITIQGGSTPESITVTDTTYTIASLAGNKVYTFSNPLTSLTITAYGDTTLETVLYFTAGTGFTFSVPSDSKYIIEEPVFNDGMSYVVSIQNGTIVMGEIVSQTVSLNSINENNE